MYELNAGLPFTPMLAGYKDYMRQRQMTLGDLLLENRIVFLGSSPETGGNPAITDYLAEHNKTPKPFVWTADADSILERLKRVCKRTSDSGHSCDRDSPGTPGCTSATRPTRTPCSTSQPVAAKSPRRRS